MQTNQISGFRNKEKLDQGEEVEEGVLNMAIAISLEEQLWKIENTLQCS